MTTNNSWIDVETVEIRDDGEEESIDTETRDILLALIDDVDDPDRRTVIARAIAACTTPARPAWPRGVFVLIKERMESGDNEDIFRLQVGKAHVRGGGTRDAGLEADVNVAQPNLALAAVVTRGFLEPMNDDGTPKHGYWTTGGKPLRSIADLSLHERLGIMKKQHPTIIDTIAREANRLNEDPFKLRAAPKALKTA